MRLSITALLSAFVVLTSVALASAEAVMVPRVTLPSSNQSGPTKASEFEIPGITAEQQNSIPYHPCTTALGWVNGRLRCYN